MTLLSDLTLFRDTDHLNKNMPLDRIATPKARRPGIVQASSIEDINKARERQNGDQIGRRKTVEDGPGKAPKLSSREREMEVAHSGALESTGNMDQK